jgi:DNA-binding CsgD family transcriptional regulator
MTGAGRTERPGELPLRVAVVAPHLPQRRSLIDALVSSGGVEVVAWADSAEPLIVLGTRADVCLCTTAPTDEHVARLREQGCAVVVAGGDPLAAVRNAAAIGAVHAARRPQLSTRQRDVLVAYVSSSDLQPTIARRLGMDPETVKTHLRRIRLKYAAAGRPAPTRRDLYVRAVEDGLLPPPSGRSWQQ